ncbi:MAG: HAMP domain-containing methyl-accepting chemotaxis protein [Muricomes sp.]
MDWTNQIKELKKEDSDMKKWFDNAKIGVKVIGGFLIVALIAGLIGGLGIISLNSVGTSYGRAYTDTVEALKLSEKISSSFQEIRTNLFEMTLADSSADKEQCNTSIDEHRKSIDNNLSQYKVLMGHHTAKESEVPRRIVAELEAAMAAFDAKRIEITNGVAMDPERRKEAFDLMSDGGELHQLSQKVESAIAAFVDFNADYTAEQIAANQRQTILAEIVMAVGIAVGILLAVLIGLYVARNLSKRIGKIVEVTDKLSRGELEVNIDITSRDEIGVLAESSQNMSDTLKTVISDLTRGLEAFAEGNFALDTQAEESYVGDYRPLLDSIRKMRDRLSAALLNINTAAEQVAMGAEQVSGGAQALSSGSTEQAASVEELTASAEKISDQAQGNLTMIAAASKSVQKSGEGIDMGNQHMAQLTHAMDEINSSSGQIANITKVVEDIAFRTNILALNAAIEAARAGNAGKGFAVVADEVRTLAAKSGEAAKQTAELIENSVTIVDRGARLTEETAQVLKAVGDNAIELVENFGKIEESITEQTGAIEQIKDGLFQISSVVQTNAATAEENSATSEEMAAQASTLRQEVGQFKLAEVLMP